jgi:hypothetical protein
MDDIDVYVLELRRRRALAHLDMYAGLLQTLSANVAYMNLLRTAAGTDPSQWEVLDTSGREYVLGQGRALLLKAAGVSRKAWDALPARGGQRSAVLLKGAERLGIDTDWCGWAFDDEAPPTGTESNS